MSTATLVLLAVQVEGDGATCGNGDTLPIRPYPVFDGYTHILAVYERVKNFMSIPSPFTGCGYEE
jgi:hypothetical protein